MKKLLSLVCLLTVVSLSTATAQKTGKKTKAQLKQEQLKQQIKDSLNAIMDKAKAGEAEAMNEVGTWYYAGKHVAQNYSTAYDWWKRSALKKNVRAIANLGLCYQLGRGVEKDSIDAMRLYKKSIKEGNTQLLKQRTETADKQSFDAMLVASCYEDGTGVKKDMAKAASYYEKAAEKGSVDGMRLAGLNYLNTKQNGKAFKMFKNGCAKNDLSSTFWYGKMLLGGMGVAADKKQATIELLKAAEQGMAAAQNEIGQLYENGDGVVKNETQAFEWYDKAAKQGFAKAMWSVGQCYKNAVGVKRDYAIALDWMAEAATVGYQKSFLRLIHNIDSIGTDPFGYYVHGMKYYIVNENLTNATAQFKKLAKAKCEEGNIMQAFIQASKKNEKPNPAKAAKTLTKYANDNAVAAFYLATLYESGNGVEKNMDKAIELYTSAANKDYGKAQCYLADIYYEGRGCLKDLTKAVQLYQQANANHQLSQNGIKRLADCIEQGVAGLTADKKAADNLRKQTYSNKVKKVLEKIK